MYIMIYKTSVFDFVSRYTCTKRQLINNCDKEFLLSDNTRVYKCVPIDKEELLSNT